MHRKNIAIYALTHQGVRLAKTLSAVLGGTLYTTRRHVGDSGAESFDSLTDLVSETFTIHDSHVFIAAAGIVVRCIAPHLQSKEVDPAVVCLDQKGRHVISLLSGHLGGGNRLAQDCARIVDGEAVITTATDTERLPSLDLMAQGRGMVIGNIDRVKVVNGALLDERVVQVFDPENCLGTKENALFYTVSNKADWKVGEPGVWVSYREDCPDTDALRLYPKLLMLGIGCRRDVPEKEISAHIRNVFDAAGLSLKSIGGLASVDIKSDEIGLLGTASKLGIEPKFYAKDALDKVLAPNPSGTVLSRVGVASVSEASALLLSEGGELLVEKTKTKTVTLAVARRKEC